MLDNLTPEERRTLVKFVCSMAWADNVLTDEERLFIARIVMMLDLPDFERTEVEDWLETPPDVDPANVPREHRQLFLDVVTEVARADGHIGHEEAVDLELLEQLTR